MSIRATFHYFQGMECDMYSFYRIPKLLFTSEYFKNLSCEAKVLYGLMLDRMSLSIKNRWFDEEDRAYIFFSVEEIMERIRLRILPKCYKSNSSNNYEGTEPSSP